MDGGGLRGKLVNYPTWPLIGANEFRAYHRALGPLIIEYMVIPLLVATILTILLLWFRPASIPRGWAWLAIGLQLVGWVSTATHSVAPPGTIECGRLSLPLIVPLRVTSFCFAECRSLPMHFFSVDDVRIATGKGQARCLSA